LSDVFASSGEEPINLDAAEAQAPPAAVQISSQEFFRRARERLTFDIPPGLTDPSIIPTTGDFGTDRMLEIIAEEKPIRQAAVLIPIIERDEPTVLLTQRSTHLNDHAGQVAFPGGKIDPGDASPMHAALREAQEEVGLEARFIEPIGYMDLYATTFGFRIVPTLARVQPGFMLKVNEAEVADVFEVPLAFLMNPANHFTKARQFRDITRHFYEMPYGERYVWGATAGMLRILYERIVAS
jgi:8-oxo-dGTP pyrophosphatase MutT (NUDIX family)